MVTYVDPPSGWRYGFPKVLPKEVTDVKKWLVEQGYPKSLTEAEWFYCRYWEGKDDTNDF